MSLDPNTENFLRKMVVENPNINISFSRPVAGRTSALLNFDSIIVEIDSLRSEIQQFKTAMAEEIGRTGEVQSGSKRLILPLVTADRFCRVVRLL
jgi:hypothetical protein